MTVNACEIEAGKDNVLHLAINSGTDLALFNALLTYVADKGWIDKDFIAASTNDFDKALAGQQDDRSRTPRKITGLKPDEIVKAAEWIAEPKEGGKRRRTMFCLREGPDLGQRQLPHQRRAREPRARDRQYRPAGRRLRAHGRPPGRLCPPLRRSCRPARAPMSTSC